MIYLPVAFNSLGASLLLRYRDYKDSNSEETLTRDSERIMVGLHHHSCNPIQSNPTTLKRIYTFYVSVLNNQHQIHAEPINQFFHKFIDYWSTTLHKKYFIAPTTKEEAGMHICDCHSAGFPGCISSTDTTYIAMDNCCTHRLKHISKGFKLNLLSSRTYNKLITYFTINKWSSQKLEQ